MSTRVQAGRCRCGRVAAAGTLLHGTAAAAVVATRSACRLRRVSSAAAAVPGQSGEPASSGAAAAESGAAAALRPLEVSRALAAARAAESMRPDSLFGDPYAEVLSEGKLADDTAAALDAVATRYIDECLMNAVNAVNVSTISRGGEYRQVVLVGDGFDTRPFRLPWPPGTVLFLVAPPEAHERAEALLAATPGGAPHVDRGCLLRRVSLNLGAATTAAASSQSQHQHHHQQQQQHPEQQQQQQQQQTASVLLSQLDRAGFRQDRLSLWAVQGLTGLGLPPAALSELLADAANAAAFHSLIVGEMPLEGARADVENTLADVGLLGAVYAHGSPDVGGGHARLTNGAESGADGERRGRWLFAAQQMRLSLGQMGIYEDHVQAAEDADEDFLGNFS